MGQTMFAFGCGLFVAVAGASGQTATVARAGALCGPDTGIFPSFHGQRDQDSVRRVIIGLNRRIATASSARLPDLLVARGFARLEYVPRDSALLDVDSVAPHTQFAQDCCSGTRLYRGGDFSEVLRRFPDSRAADSAAYGLTLLDHLGECEGDADCPIDLFWSPVSPFLKARPRSPLADVAVARGLYAFKLDPDIDMRLKVDYFDPDAVRPYVLDLDSVGRVQTGARRARLMLRAAQLWMQFSDYGRARSAANAALATAPPAIRACLTTLIASIPTASFPLDTVHVVNTRRAVLRWAAPAPAVGVVVRRGEGTSDTGVVIATLAAATDRWTDTTIRAGAHYWYRVEITSASGRGVRSNVSKVDVPEARVWVQRVAVSTSDSALYVFGTLANRFPQVGRIARQHDAVNWTDGALVDDRGHGATNPEVPDVWLADQGGVGVLHFTKQANEPPAALLASLRAGSDLAVRQFAAALGGQRGLNEYDYELGNRAVLSVDQAAGSAWMRAAGNLVSMSCVSHSTLCWLGYIESAALRAESGPVAQDILSTRHRGCAEGCATAIYSDPHDSSAYVILGRASAPLMGGPAKLLHVDRTGVTRQTLEIGPVGGDVGMTPATFDQDRRLFWFLNGLQLFLVDFHDGDPHAVAVHANLRRGDWGWLAPDLEGGVWVVNGRVAQRVSRTGQIVRVVNLAP